MARRVLITGARAVAALDIARDFAAAGWEPHLADSVPVRMARWSKAPARVHRYPAPRQQGAAFRARIVELVDTFGFEQVVPTCEEVFHLAAPALHRRLGERLFVPNLATLRQLHDKFAFARHCGEWGLPVPERHPIDCVEGLERFASRSREWVFKPRFSRFGDSALVAPDRRVLAAITPSPDAPWMAQARIHGEEVCFHGVAHRGELVAFAAYRSSWRLGGGAGYAFEPAADQHREALRKIAARLAQCAVIHGQFACDAMFDEAGAAYLLECNPRATSGVHLLTGVGHLAHAIGDGIAAPEAAPRTLYLGPAMVVFGLPQAVRGARVRDWWRCFATGRDVVSRPGDRWPLLGALCDAASFSLTGFKHNISTNAAATYDLEWNGEELP
ncbi:ATP-grasp domain-containing protein [Vreelandella neptunia]|uniref:ATP-grasp domain-containing protein n=1 Tax=Vreelandella neptunia TaxID=115551 RepID=A0ABZ0YP06_9GAMM|nr:ATP-grasp domain-containing protein [Halomonas neptunia]MDN3558910.1 ATP-grasp domain-containing protein [Halomonas neptunia]TDV98150.1 ATP-grasp domain-containing protein [Halomonas alkaliantarctica]WQH13875.1 ATP-grasp domain-containing protein [Halomonas neptunia]